MNKENIIEDVDLFPVRERTLKRKYQAAGPDHKMSKFNAIQVNDIRRKFLFSGKSAVAISKEYNVTPITIRNIVKGRSYKNVSLDEDIVSFIRENENPIQRITL